MIYVNFNFKTKLIFSIMWVFTCVMFSFQVYSEPSLTDIFSTKAFQGSWEVINKFNWVGQGFNMMISVFCLMGLILTFAQRFSSYLYLASRNLFDEVHDIKNSSKGSGILGLGGMSRDMVTGARGVGFDSILVFLLGLLPDIKRYSDFNPERRMYNINEDDSVVTYSLKVALPTIMLTFFFTIGFSGTFGQAYGTVVSAMASAADRAVSTNLDLYVNRLMSRGESYSFTIGSNNTETGKLAERVSRDIYGKVLHRMNILDTTHRLEVGQKVEAFVWNYVLGGQYETPAGNQLENLVLKSVAIEEPSAAHYIRTAADVKAIKIETRVNTSPTIASEGGPSASFETDFGLSVPMSHFIPANYETIGDELYIHLIFSKVQRTEANYFKSPDSD